MRLCGQYFPYSQVAYDVRQGTPCPNCISGPQQGLGLWSCVYSWPIVQIIRFGVSGETLRWFSSFFTNRQQCVRVNGSSSNTQCWISGIPQGTVLGPLLFLIFINDLPKSMTNNCSIFADDMTAYTTGKNITTTAVGLSDDVTAASSWADIWGMLFNAEKANIWSSVVEDWKVWHHNPPYLWLAFRYHKWKFTNIWE